MHESDAVPSVAKIARALSAVDTVSVAIAGFALFAGTRAFTFLAALAWREPLLGGTGLMLLAVVGWVRWCYGHMIIDKPTLQRGDRLE
jgi:hypothetical protein